MCGIFGSFQESKFRELFDLNTLQGNSGYGCLYINDKKYIQIKQQYTKSINIDKNYSCYLGHIQAPTSKDTIWKKENCHPFEYKHILVAHNGVITNTENIKSKYNLNPQTNVDTELISIVLADYGIDEVTKTFEGTYSLWIFDKNTDKITVLRHSSMLYTDGKNFSTVKFDKSELIEDNTIHNYNIESQQLVFERHIKNVKNYYF